MNWNYDLNRIEIGIELTKNISPFKMINEFFSQKGEKINERR